GATANRAPAHREAALDVYPRLVGRRSRSDRANMFGPRSLLWLRQPPSVGPLSTTLRRRAEDPTGKASRRNQSSFKSISWLCWISKARGDLLGSPYFATTSLTSGGILAFPCSM